MVEPKPSPFDVGPRLSEPPSGDAAREAVASLRGYAFQLYASALAWLELRPEQELYLEVAEDYCIAAKGALEAVQAKDTGPAVVTINSADVLETLDAFVGLVEFNPNREVRLRFLSTSPIGQERQVIHRPAGKSALNYWRQAAAGADVAPLRTVLTQAKITDRLRKFIEDRDDAALREQFLRRIHWDCGREGVSGVKDELEAGLVRYGTERLGLTSVEAGRLSANVLQHLFHTVIQSRPRRLTDVDLQCVCETATKVLISRGSLDRLLQGTAFAESSQSLSRLEEWPSVFERESEIPLPTLFTSRRPLISALSDRVRRHGTLFVTGSSGRGKTIVARLVARNLEGTWFVIDLRNASPTETAQRLALALKALGAFQPAGVILDDLNEGDDVTARTALVRFLAALQQRDAVCLVTAYRNPSARALSELALDADACHAVPELTTDEVAEMVKAAGGDARWANTVHMAGGHGHPQLVQALISGLRARQWPAKELRALRSFDRSVDVDAERLAARRQLVTAVPDQAKALMYRSSLIIGRFDRAIVITLGSLSPAVAMPGEQLDVLIGPWIEPFSHGQFRVSPLLSGAGEAILSLDEQATIHRTLAESYMAGPSYDVARADVAFLHALRGKSEVALLKLATGIVVANQETRKALAEWITGIRIHRTDRSIYPEHPEISRLLRLAQLLLLFDSGAPDKINEAWEALRREIASEPKKKERESFEFMALGKLLVDPSGAAILPDWIGLILLFSELLEVQPDKRRILKHLGEPVGSIHVPTPVGMIFIVQAMGIRSVPELKAAFDRLDKLAPARRDALFVNVIEMPSDFALIVNHPWIEQHDRGGIDWLACAELYREMAEMARAWGYRQLAVRCHIARGIMFDEYDEDPVAALNVLDEATAIVGPDPALSRARAKVLYRRKDYAAALVLLRDAAEDVARNDPVERAFMFREAGISAAETGDWREAGRWFSAAADAASQVLGGDIKWMAIGLLADEAIAAFFYKDTSFALKLMANAFDALQASDATSSIRAGYCHRVIRHTALWINQETTKREMLLDGVPTAVKPGMCSNPEPPNLQDLPLGHLDIAWYLLAEAEIVTNVDAGINSKLCARLKGRSIPMMEIGLRHARLFQAATHFDAERYLEELGPWVDAAIFEEGHRAELRELTGIDPVYGVIPPASSEQLQTSVALFARADAILAFGVVAALSHQVAALKNFHVLVVASEMDQSFQSLTAAMCGEGELSSCTEQLTAAEIFKLATQLDAQPDDAFVSCYRLLQFLTKSNLKSSLVPLLADWAKARWIRIIEEQQFLLKNPMRTVGAVRDVLARPFISMEAIAALLLASEPTLARTRLDSGSIDFLKTLAYPNHDMQVTPCP